MSAPAETVTEPSKTTTLSALKSSQLAAQENHLPNVTVGFTSLQAFQLIWRVANMFASSSIVPARFQNNPANCAIALEMAQRLGASPLLVMQNLYTVHGSPGWSAKFLIACFNQCGRYTSLKYAFEGTRGKDDWGARAWATEKSTGERIEGPLINIELAKKEGWYGRKDSKWQSMPEQMLRYRSGAWMINTTAPEISMGLRTTDELEDMGSIEARQDAAGHFAVDLDALRNTPAQQQGNATEKPDEDKIPNWDKDTAITAIRNSTALKQLSEVYERIVLDFADTNRPLPVEVEGAFGDKKATLEQAQE